jgi:hypothetical protein
MEQWRSHIVLSRPFWEDYRDRLLQLDSTAFPSAAELNRILPPGLHGKRGQPIRFVPAGELPDVEYEKHIFCTGEVSTRENNWHDLFNALVWSRLPRLKVAMNAVHFEESGSGGQGSRGMKRDALTLFDESGVIVISANKNLLGALARKDWKSAFVESASVWKDEIKIIVVGHALLEKFLRPYKSLTAHALLLRMDDSPVESQHKRQLPVIDQLLAERILEGSILESPACLSPLPLMGIPGWWPGGAQDSEFYDDRQVFRPNLAASRAKAHLHLF